MKNFVSPNSHPSSYCTGSTLESMIDRAVELDTGYYVCTDNGYLQNTLKAYNYAKKKGIQLIAGCELYFVDSECPLTNNEKTRPIRYYTITVHAQTQEAYQFLVSKISEQKRNTIKILDHDYPAFNWADLEEFSKKDFTVVLGGPQDIVCKNILVDDTKAAYDVFLKLLGMFESNLYTSIIPLQFDKKWVSESVFTLADGQTVHLDSTLMAETGMSWKGRVSLEEVANKPARHKTIKRIYVNGVGYNVNKDIISAINHKDFKPIGVDIFAKYNNAIKMFSKRHGVKMLLNDYSYFTNEGDKLVQNMKLGEVVRFYTKNSMKTTEEIIPYLKSTGFSDVEIEELVNNTYEWSSNFDEFELKYEYRLVNEHEDPLKATFDIIKKVGRFDYTNPEHCKRLKHEIDVLHNNGIIDLLPYMFPIEKALDYYKEHNRLIAPGRGSAAGSILLYFMGITQVDPIKYNLQFSRFLTLGRIKGGSLPDIDIDMPSRDLLTKEGGFLDTHYKGRWAQVSTRTLMRLKSSIRDVNRFVNGEVEEEIEILSKRLPAAPQGISDHDFVFGYEKEGTHVPGVIDKDDSLLQYTKDRPEEWEIVKRTLGISRQSSRHASAFVISDVPVSDVIPTMKIGEFENITQYEAKEVEEAGLIKYDFLVVKCLNDIELAMKLINDKHGKVNTSCIPNLKLPIKYSHFMDKGEQQDIWNLPEDPEVFQMLSDGHAETIFQLHTVSVKPYMMGIKPTTVMDIATIEGLVRPGPLDFIDEETGLNMAEEYVERRQGRSRGDIPILEKLMPETHGVFIFQESITKVTKELTGWDDEKAEDIRIAVGKKKIKMINELKPQFIESSIKNGKTDEATIRKIWNMIETFGSYGFNASHAVSYAMIAYACAYLKHHYKLEWWTAVLSNAPEKEITEVLWPHVKDILSAPDINLSKEEMVIDYKNGTIRNKLSILRGLGTKAADKITDGRPYTDIHDFVNKKVCGVALTRKIIHIGVLDSIFEPNTSIMDKMQIFENAVEEQKYRKKIFDRAPDINQNRPIQDVIEDAKTHEKTKRCKHDIPEGKIDEQYIFMNPIKDYILKKSTFPTMPMNLHEIIKDSAQSIKIMSAGDSLFCLDRYGKEVRFINGTTFQKIKNLEVQLDSDKVIHFCTTGYVIEAAEFSYKDGERKAFKLNVDIDGFLEEFVVWPDYDTGVLEYDENIKKGSVVFLFMYRKMSKEKYHTNIDNVIVEDILIK